MRLASCTLMSPVSSPVIIRILSCVCGPVTAKIFTCCDLNLGPLALNESWNLKVGQYGIHGIPVRSYVCTRVLWTLWMVRKGLFRVQLVPVLCSCSGVVKGR